MISKIIYTCWLSDINNMPEEIQQCINTQLIQHQDYEHVIINYNKFAEIRDILPDWVNKAFEKRDYAHVSDYLRVYFVYKYGGIYLDSDVMCIKNYNLFDKYLKYDFFGNLECSNDYYPVQHVLGKQYTSDILEVIDLNSPELKHTFMLDMEYWLKDSTIRNTFLNSNDNYNIKLITFFKYGIAVDGAMFGASKGCSLLKDVLDMYNSELFSKYVENTDIIKNIHYYPNICNIIAKNLEKYGFKYKYKYGKAYKLNDNKYLLNTDKFISIEDYKNRENNNCELVHLCKGSWKD